MQSRPVIGTRLPGAELPLTDHDMIAAYLAASGDDNPLHRDARIARAAGFEDVLVPGMLLMAQMAEILAAWPRCAALLQLQCRFVEPVPVGMRLHCEGRIVATETAGKVVVRLTAGQGRRFVVVGEATIVLA